MRLLRPLFRSANANPGRSSNSSGSSACADVARRFGRLDPFPLSLRDYADNGREFGEEVNFLFLRREPLARWARVLKQVKIQQCIYNDIN